MPPKSLHEENRAKICAACGKKIVLGNNKLHSFLITSRYEDLIKKRIDSDFDLTDSHFPVSVCNTCKLILNEHEKENLKRPLPEMPNYKDIHLIQSTRATNDLCNCYICLKARYKGHEKIEKGVGHKRKLSDEIDESNGLFGNVSNKKYSKEIQHKESQSITICKNCFTTLSKGKQHTCDKISARENVNKFIEQLPQKHQEQIISEWLKKKLSMSEQSSKTPELSLSTQGSKLHLTLGKLKSHVSKSFTEENLDDYRTINGLSLNHMIKLTNLLRCTVGKKSVPAHIIKHLSDKSKTLDTFYNTGRFEFDTGTDKTSKQIRPVVWANATELLDCIIDRRNIIGNVMIKVLADSGQGFLKLSMTVLPEDYSDEKDNKRKMTSVHKLLILCVVPDIKESYDNLKLIFDLTQLNDIPYKFACDFKLLLIVNGQQTATASFPCPYCFVPLQCLRTNGEVNSSLPSTSTADSEKRENCSYENDLKTFGDMREDYKKFVSLNKDKKLAKECHSTVNAPLFDEDDDTCVLQKCVIPELHVLMGFVNHLFWKGLVPLLGRERALLWPKSLCVISKNYQGEAFEGNACRKLLKHPDELLKSNICGEVGPLKLVPFVSSFKAMDKLVNACFSTRQVNSNCEKLVKELETAFYSTGVTETLKIHVILKHLSQCLNYLGKSGLGIWSEQSGEAIHNVFLKNYWNRYKINMVDDDRYLSNLKKAVVEFSSQHI